MYKTIGQLGDLIPSFYALAAKLEGEGQYNNAKLVRAAAEAIIRQAAYQRGQSAEKSNLLRSMRHAIELVSAFGLSDDLIQALQHGTEAMESSRLPLIHETPDAYVCRTCGYLALNEPKTSCPTCGARPQTFIGYAAVYWLEALTPPEALEHLRQTPKDVASLLAGLTEEITNQMPESGGWNLHSAVAHLRDAQAVLEMRIHLMLENDNPRLESQAVFEWAEQEGELAETTADIFGSYDQSRERTLTLLESLPRNDWQRTGEHEEFGTLTIQKQVSYFAFHELIHMPQIESLVHP
jgi:hypothetical protein